MVSTEVGVPYKSGSYTDSIVSEMNWERELERKALRRDMIADMIKKGKIKKKDIHSNFNF